MKIFATNRTNTELERGIHMMPEHRGPEGPIPPHERPIPPHERPIPPHERRKMLQIELDEKDITKLEKVFGDEDTAFAAEQVILEAPPEIQILALQLLDLIKEEM